MNGIWECVAGISVVAAFLLVKIHRTHHWFHLFSGFFQVFSRSDTTASGIAHLCPKQFPPAGETNRIRWIAHFDNPGPSGATFDKSATAGTVSSCMAHASTNRQAGGDNPHGTPLSCKLCEYYAYTTVAQGKKPSLQRYPRPVEFRSPNQYIGSCAACSDLMTVSRKDGRRIRENAGTGGKSPDGI